MRKISRAAASFDSYLSFLDEAIMVFRRADACFCSGKLNQGDMIQVKRDLHTLKGSIGTFDFTSLAQEIHRLESLIEEEGFISPKVPVSWERIKDQWKFETSDIETVLGLKQSQSKITVSKAKFERLCDHVRALGNVELQELVEDTTRVPLKEAFHKYEKYIENLIARSLEKQVRLVYTSDSSEVTHSEIQRLDAVFVHLFRNSLDHGIESSELRLSSRKTVAGTIQLACYRRKNQALHFILKDDGQGVNGDKLAQKAVKSGVWSDERAAKASYQEKTELVFVPSLSVKDEVTEISGRGVGIFEFDVPPSSSVHPSC
ncbi:MAG: Hpt domain-containing protein [Proteobacteria bacterium]|nr:Hpt domain-containing protein [Pseudomonadota bacterium]